MKITQAASDDYYGYTENDFREDVDTEPTIAAAHTYPPEYFAEVGPCIDIEDGQRNPTDGRERNANE